MEDALIATKTTVFDHTAAKGYDAFDRYDPDELTDICEAHADHYDTVAEIESILETEEVPYDVVHADELDNVEADTVFSVGGDGTVLETAKYLDEEVLVPIRSDGKSRGGLCLYGNDEASAAVEAVVDGEYDCQNWNRITGDPGDLPALNEVYIGAQDATDAARYDIGGDRIQSSGLIISTGAGSTGWYQNVNGGQETFDPEQEQLRAINREPIGEDPGITVIEDGDELIVRSEMNDHKDPIIRYDGDKNRTYPFPRGETARFRLSETPLTVAGPATGLKS